MSRLSWSHLVAVVVMAAFCSACGPKGSISGKVEFWGEDRVFGVVDVQVTMTRAPDGAELAAPVVVTSASNGRFEVNGLSPGATYELQVNDPTLVTDSVRAGITDENPTVELSQPLRAHPWHDAKVTVQHCLTGAPIAGAAVTIDGSAAVTDAEGVVSREGVGPPDKEIAVTVTADGLLSGSSTIELSSSPPWVRESKVILCPGQMPARSAMVYADAEGNLKALKPSSLKRDQDITFGKTYYHIDRKPRLIPLAEADAAPRIGSRRRLLVDSQLLQRHGRWNAGAFYARLLKSEPDGTVPKKRDWLTNQTDRPPRDMKVPNPGAYVGSRFSHLPVASSFQVNAEWTKLIDVTVRGVETPEGWTLVELSGVGPWGIVTTNDPARDQIFIAAR